MIETELRDELRRAADRVAPSDDLRGRVEHRIDVHDRRARRTRAGLAAGVLAFVAVAAGVAVAASGDGVRSVGPAGPATPRTSAPGWSTIQPAPIGPRFQHAEVWTGRELVVLGGYLASGDAAPGGAAYDPAAGTWRVIAQPPGDLRSPLAAWTGTELLVLDGQGALRSYDPTADAWSDRAPSGFSVVADSIMGAVWTGRELVVVASQDASDRRVPQLSEAYDPATDTWRDLPAVPFGLTFGDTIWTGDRVVVAGDTGGSGRDAPHLELWSLDPAGGGWEALPAPPLVDPGHRRYGFAAWSGTELVVGGGEGYVDGPDGRTQRVDRQDVAAYDPVAGTWRSLPNAPLPVAGQDRTGEIWTGSELMVPSRREPIGGGDGWLLLDPASGTWRVASPEPLGNRSEAPAVWTGHEVVVWSGEPSGSDPEPATCCVPDAGGDVFTP